MTAPVTRDACARPGCGHEESGGPCPRCGGNQSDYPDTERDCPECLGTGLSAPPPAPGGRLTREDYLEELYELIRLSEQSVLLDRVAGEASMRESQESRKKLLAHFDATDLRLEELAGDRVALKSALAAALLQLRDFRSLAQEVLLWEGSIKRNEDGRALLTKIRKALARAGGEKP